MQRINYNQLYYFYCVASLGSIKATCAKLLLSQPTISSQIKNLEISLNIELFTREHHKLSLTSKGKIIFDKVSKTFMDIENLSFDLQDINKNFKRGLKVGASQTMPSSFVHDYCRRLIKSSGAEVELVIDTANNLPKMLEREQIDCVLSEVPFTGVNKKIWPVNLKENKLFLVGSVSQIYSHAKSVSNLQHFPFIHYSPDSMLYHKIESFFSLNSLKPIIAARTNDLHFMTKTVMSGIGLGILPELQVSREIMQNELILISEITEIKSSFWLMFSANHQNNIYLNQTELLECA